MKNADVNRIAEFIRLRKSGESGLDFCSEESCVSYMPHDWCYDCANDLIERIAVAVKKEFST